MSHNKLFFFTVVVSLNPTLVFLIQGEGQSRSSRSRNLLLLSTTRHNVPVNLAVLEPARPDLPRHKALSGRRHQHQNKSPAGLHHRTALRLATDHCTRHSQRQREWIKIFNWSWMLPPYCLMPAPSGTAAAAAARVI